MQVSQPLKWRQLPEGSDSGTVCVSAFEDSNASGFREAGEELLAGVLIKISNEQQDMGSLYYRWGQ